MNTPVSEYRKCLLNRVTISPKFTEYVESSLIIDNETTKHFLHKVIVHNFNDNPEDLFDNLSSYLGTVFIPVQFSFNCGIASFYTNNLNVILKILKTDFLFPFHRTMYSIDVLLNDKTTKECFGEDVSLEDIVNKIVSNRFNEHFELDLSDFCNDPELKRKNIHFYKLSLLTAFKILMIRMGRDTLILNLSNNNLSVVPQEIMNFFIKGSLIGVNLSNNNLQSMNDVRVISRIEKLWLEGNPLCELEDEISYIKQISMKFPRISELDGVKLNEHGIIYPFHKNFLVNPHDRRTKMVVEKFLTLYFSHFDTSRVKVANMYDDWAQMTINTDFDESEDQLKSFYHNHSRNILDPRRRRFVLESKKSYVGPARIRSVFSQMPPTVHDPTTFKVDVLRSDNKGLIVVVEGVFKEEIMIPPKTDIIYFRRTFVFQCYLEGAETKYNIVNEIFSITRASEKMVAHSFTKPIRNPNTMVLINPDREDIESITGILCHLTHLKPKEAEMRLCVHNWDLKKTLMTFSSEMKNNSISPDKFVDENDQSDLSSIDDID